MRATAVRLLAALGVALLIVSAATVALFSAPSVAVLTRVTHGEAAWREGSSPSGNTVAADAEFARKLVFGAAPDAPLDRAGTVGFDDGSISHLRDVGSVVWVAIGITAVLGAGLLALALRWAAFAARALTDGSVVALGMLAVVGVAAGLWFEPVFIALHEVLFTPGTWMFSADSLLIRTFPEPFWMAAAGAWVAVAVSLAAALWTIGRRLGRRAVR